VGAFVLGAGYYATKKNPDVVAQPPAEDFDSAADRFEAGAASLDPAADSTDAGITEIFESASK